MGVPSPLFFINTFSTDSLTCSKNDNEVNKTSRAGKIGRKSNSTVNKEAATAQAAAMLQLQQLQQGKDVMTADEAKTAVQDIVDNVSIHYDGDAQSADMHVREAMLHQIDTATTTEQAKAARTAYNQTVDRQNAAYKERNQEVKSQYKNAKSDTGKNLSYIFVIISMPSLFNAYAAVECIPTSLIGENIGSLELLYS